MRFEVRLIETIEGNDVTTLALRTGETTEAQAQRYFEVARRALCVEVAGPELELT